MVRNLYQLFIFAQFLVLFMLLNMAIAKAQDAATPSAAAAAPAQANAGPGIFSGDDGQPLDVTADESLEWNEIERVYTAKGNAKAVRGDVTVEADILKAYDRKLPDGSSEVWRLTAEGNVRIHNKDSRAEGDQAEYDIDTKKAVLTGEKLVLVTPSDRVTATESLEYYENEQMAVARGKARAVREGRRVQSDVMIARLQPNRQGKLDIHTLEAKGHVNITTEKDVIFCDAIVYNVVDGKAVLTGNVKVTQGDNQLRGDRVESDFKTGRSRLVNTGKSGRVHALISAAKGGGAPAPMPSLAPAPAAAMPPGVVSPIPAFSGRP